VDRGKKEQGRWGGKWGGKRRLPNHSCRNTLGSGIKCRKLPAHGGREVNIEELGKIGGRRSNTLALSRITGKNTEGLERGAPRLG